MKTKILTLITIVGLTLTSCFDDEMYTVDETITGSSYSGNIESITFDDGQSYDYLYNSMGYVTRLTVTESNGSKVWYTYKYTNLSSETNTLVRIVKYTSSSPDCAVDIYYASVDKTANYDRMEVSSGYDGRLAFSPTYTTSNTTTSSVSNAMIYKASTVTVTDTIGSWLQEETDYTVDWGSIAGSVSSGNTILSVSGGSLTTKYYTYSTTSSTTNLNINLNEVLTKMGDGVFFPSSDAFASLDMLFPTGGYSLKSNVLVASQYEVDGEDNTTNTTTFAYTVTSSVVYTVTITYSDATTRTATISYYE